MPIENQATNPSVGMMAIVRGKRRAVISEVRPFLGEDQVLHVVRVDYKDDQFPLSEELIWEREPYRKLREPTALPNPSDPPMPTDQFDALINASRWNALTPFLDPDADGPLGPVPLLTFSCQPFLHDISGRKIFRPNPNIQMVNLGHPLMTQAINLLGQRRYPGTKYSVSRWTARYANLQNDFHSPICPPEKPLQALLLRTQTDLPWPPRSSRKSKPICKNKSNASRRI